VVSNLRKSFILFPFLFGIYPVLAMIGHNAAEIDLLDGLRALFIAIIITLVIYVVILVLVKVPIKAALITTLPLLAFYSYGHVNILSRSWTIFNLSIGRHRNLIPVYFLIFILILWLILRTKRDLSPLTRFINAFAVFLILFPLYQIAAFQVEDTLAQREQQKITSANAAVKLPQNITPPDVYYILVDGYPRSDFISQYFDSDNSEFLKELEQRGFYVAHCSQSNYTDTRFSMASTLNMVYLDDGTGQSEVVFPGSTLDSMIRSGIVQQNFADLGYKIVTFESGYKWLRWEEADLHLDPVVERSRRQFFEYRD